VTVKYYVDVASLTRNANGYYEGQVLRADSLGMTTVDSLVWVKTPNNEILDNLNDFYLAIRYPVWNGRRVYITQEICCADEPIVTSCCPDGTSPTIYVTFENGLSVALEWEAINSRWVYYGTNASLGYIGANICTEPNNYRIFVKCDGTGTGCKKFTLKVQHDAYPPDFLDQSWYSWEADAVGFDCTCDPFYVEMEPQTVVGLTLCDGIWGMAILTT
jgi:hypothetical protein